MAKSNPLDKFKKLYDDIAGGKSKPGIENLIPAYDQNRDRPEVKDTLINLFVSETGQADPRVDPLDPQGRRLITVPAEDVYRMANSVQEVYHTRVRNYMKEPRVLERIVTGLDDNKLVALALSTSPKKLKKGKDKGSTQHNKIASLHEKYLQYEGAEHLAGSNNPNERREGFSAIYNDLEKATEDMLNEKKMSKQEIGIFKDTIGYLASKNPGYALQIYHARTEKVKKELLNELKDKVKARKYVRNNVSKSSDEEKDAFYRALFEITKK